MTHERIVIVTGSRYWTDRKAIYDRLDFLRPGLVVHGGARGADAIADEWARKHGVPSHPERAEWKRYGPAAGPIRNGRMLRRFPTAEVSAFPLPRGSGTQDCIAQARALGMVRVWVWPEAYEDQGE